MAIVQVAERSERTQMARWQDGNLALEGHLSPKFNGSGAGEDERNESNVKYV